jgi:putative transposase
MNPSPVRKKIRLAPQSYFGRQHYVVTLCSFRRQTAFLDPAYCQRLLDLLATECASRDFSVPAYCLMPDHLHFLAEGSDPASDLLQLVKSFKIKTSRDYATRESHILWQGGFYEHILRSGENIESVAWYIWLNPVRNRMVSRPQDYRFAGSFTGLKMPGTWNEPNCWRPPWE